METGKLSLGNSRLRYYDNGVMYLSRNSQQSIAYMDSNFDRIPNQMAWRPRCVFDKSRRPSELAYHFGRHAYIVGKGKSADDLEPKHFPTNDPIIGVNEAFIHLEQMGLPNTIFGVRQDSASGIRMPATTAIMLIPTALLPVYATYPRTYCFNSKKDFGITHACASVVVGMGFAKAMGCKVLTMYGFDGYTVGSVEYGKMANCRNLKCDNLQILKQRNQLVFLDTKGMNIRWVTPDLENYLTVV